MRNIPVPRVLIHSEQPLIQILVLVADVINPSTSIILLGVLLLGLLVCAPASESRAGRLFAPVIHGVESFVVTLPLSSLQNR